MLIDTADGAGVEADEVAITAAYDAIGSTLPEDAPLVGTADASSTSKRRSSTI